MYTEANRKQKVSKERKLNSLQDGYLGFSKFLDFDPKKFKKQNFLEKVLLDPKFSKFSKNRIICIGHTGE